ncbi:MAG: thiamine phosphate synthase [Succiniclasticum sp.]|jgi:thiamine-phosphate pyrophosphorylase
MDKKLDLRLYLVTDESCLPEGVTLLDAVEQALQAGVTLVQYREKNGKGGPMLAKAKALTELCHRYGVPLLVDDRLDVALAAGADGVHLGQDDLPCDEARRLADKVAGPDFIIGVSAHTAEEAAKAQADGADYLGCGAVFPTNTKRGVKATGIQHLRSIKAAVTIPFVGIGGIKPEHYMAVRATGAAGVAVVTAILGASDIPAAVHKFTSQF